MKLDRALLVLPKHQHGIGFELGRADLLFLVAEAGDGTTITPSGAASSESATTAKRCNVAAEGSPATAMARSP